MNAVFPGIMNVPAMDTQWLVGLQRHSNQWFQAIHATILWQQSVHGLRNSTCKIVTWQKYCESRHVHVNVVLPLSTEDKWKSCRHVLSSINICQQGNTCVTWLRAWHHYWHIDYLESLVAGCIMITCKHCIVAAWVHSSLAHWLPGITDCMLVHDFLEACAPSISWNHWLLVHASIS